jgi:formylglycine-generating enzyme required for sulfatase activity
MVQGVQLERDDFSLRFHARLAVKNEAMTSKQQQPMDICFSRIFGCLLLALACLVAGCGKHSSDLRRNGTIDLGDGVKMEFVLVQPGSFKMGSDYADEAPAHDVLLTKPFYLGKYEVTQKQWLKVMKINPSQFEGPALPVDNVSWDDGQTFLKKLRKKTGEKFALPTEAQWEYACRADTTSRYSWGDRVAEAQDYAWFADNSGRTTHPAGEKKPNAWGLYDMNGNVWEWCADSLGPYPAGAVTNPLVSSSGQLHAVRGGGFTSKADGLRCSNRDSEWRGVRSFGLRCAIVVD